jgi:hypothetical protein
MRAATTLGRTVRWTEQGAVLDTDLLLGDLLADRGKKYAAFTGPDFTTVIERDTLVRTGIVRRLYLDHAAWVDAAGLHVRWRGGRGGFNWRPRFVAPVDRERVLTVELRPPARAREPKAGSVDGGVAGADGVRRLRSATIRSALRRSACAGRCGRPLGLPAPPAPASS